LESEGSIDRIERGLAAASGLASALKQETSTERRKQMFRMLVPAGAKTGETGTTTDTQAAMNVAKPLKCCHS